MRNSVQMMHQKVEKTELNLKLNFFFLNLIERMTWNMKKKHLIIKIYFRLEC